jgi:hypothetical protein
MKQSARPQAKIISEFNALLSDIIGVFEKKSRSATEMSMINRLKKRISLLRSTVGDGAVIDVATQPFIDYSEQILDPNVAEREKFFMTVDVRTQCLKYQRVINNTDEFFFALVDAIRQHYTSSSAEERTEIYSKVTSMLRCAIEYKISIGG